jgi:hypothetical protein
VANEDEPPDLGLVAAEVSELEAAGVGVGSAVPERRTRRKRRWAAASAGIVAGCEAVMMEELLAAAAAAVDVEVYQR